MRHDAILVVRFDVIILQSSPMDVLNDGLCEND